MNVIRFHRASSAAFRCGLVAILALLAWCGGESASACNIPVFRYALERWKADNYELLVFRQPASQAETDAWMAGVEADSQDRGGKVNVSVRAIDPATADREDAALWRSLQQAHQAELPYVVVRLKTKTGRTVDAWHGAWSMAIDSGLFDSPVRQELSRRLLRGHAVVWVILKSGDPAIDEPLAKLVREQCEQLESRLKLPEGIGLPGSELYSEVPLLLKFSFLEVDRNSPTEKLLTHLMSNFHPDPNQGSQALVAPVFGRGRMLEVIPASDIHPDLMEDLAMFMSGACSCQVKDRNPGVDLLFSTNWEREMFGDGGLRPPAATTSPSAAPALLAIPPGRQGRGKP
jgi:hypothetical protein